MDESLKLRLVHPSGFLATFEQLSHFVPAALVIATAPGYIYHAVCDTRCARANALLWLKLAIAAAWSAVQINVVFLWWESSPQASIVMRWGAVASYMSMPSVALIIVTGHLFSLRSAPFLSVFLAITLILDIGAFPTYFSPASLDPSTSPRTAILLLKVVLLGLEQVPKASLFLEQAPNAKFTTKEIVTGLWKTPLGKWAQSVLILGFRTTIKEEDLPEMDSELHADRLYDLFVPQWKKVDKSSTYALLKALLHTVPGLCLSTVPALLVRSIFKLSQPFLIRDVFTAASLSDLPIETTRKLVLTTAMVYLGIAASHAWAGYSRARLTAAVRAIAEAAIYNKSLSLNESQLDMPVLASLMNRDLNDLEWFIRTTFDNWIIVFEMMFNVAMLASLAGPAAILVVVPSLLAVTNAVRIGNTEMVDRNEWRRRIAEHSTITSNFLAQIKDIKILGLGSYFGKRLQQYHKEELRVSLAVRHAESIGFAQGAFNESITPMFSVAAALFPLFFSRTLELPDLCAAFGIGLISMKSMGFLVRSVSDRLRGFDCLHRIQQFLLQKENKDSRVCAPERLYVVEHDPRRRRDVITRFAVQFIDVAITLGGETPILQGVSLLIPKGKLSMLYGRTGAGKTLFLKMIIGQAPLSSGTLLVATTSIAYCAQKPWIRNVSLRDNIVGQLPFEPEWFNLIIYVCALDVDVARLAYGILTLAGNGGSNLSAGQKQRLSLARSLYAKEEIIVVDDLFTSLDKRTSSDIRVRLFGETELLQTHGITLIMTTTMREHLVDADFALEITDDGLICEASTENIEQTPRTLPQGVASDAAASGSEAPTVYPSPLLENGANDVPDRIYGEWGLYKFFLRPAGAYINLFWAYTLVAAAVVENLPVVFVCFWMQHDPNNRAYFLIYAAFALASPTFNYFTSVTYFYCIYTRTARALYQKVADTTFRATLDFLTSTDTSFLLNKFCEDVSMTTLRLPLQMMPMAWNFVLLITSTVAFTLASSSLILPTIMLGCLFALQFFYSRSNRHVNILHGNADGKFSSHLSDTGAGIDHIQTFGWKHNFLEQFYLRLKQKNRARFHVVCLSQWLLLMVYLLPALVSTTVVANVLSSEAKVSPAICAFALFTCVVFGSSMYQLVAPWVFSDAILNGVHRIRTFVNATPVEIAPKDAAPVPTEWARRGKIELSCVSAQYRPIGGARHIALDHVSFTIQPGHIVGIAGRTGSGKTSIFLSLLNLLHFEGAIFIDDREIRTVPHEVLRSRITVMTQNVLELTGTVRFNVNPFDPQLKPQPFILYDDMLIGIFRRVGIWDHIERRGGLDQPFRLMRFSHGQKQLFQLARAILHRQMMRTRIILIDEGAPNAEIEDHIRQVMREVFAGCTILMVSHRPSLFREADRILTVDAGKTCLYEHDRERGVWSANRWN